MERRAPRFEIVKDGHLWAIHTDAPAAVPTQGVAIKGLSIGDVREMARKLRGHGRTVITPEGFDVVAPVGSPSERMDCEPSAPLFEGTKQ